MNSSPDRKELSPKGKRSAILVGAAVVVIGGMWILSRPGVLSTNTPPVNANNMLQGGDARTLGVASINAELEDEKRNNRELSARLEEQKKKDDSLQHQIDDLAKKGSGAAARAAATKPDAPPAANIPLGLPATSPSAARPPITGPAPAAGPPQIGGNASRSGGTPGQQAPPPPPPRIREISAVGESDGLAKKAEEKKPAIIAATIKPAEEKGIYIPSGSMLTGVLLTGLDAPTGKKATEQTIPVLVRIKDPAILPNMYRADVRECMTVASGYGELSSERAYLRAESFSCIRNDGGVIDVQLKMFATGEDGMAGMRGRLVSRQGAVVARALLAGFAEGAAQALQPYRVPVLATSTSGNQFSTPSGSDGLRAAGFGGTGDALERIAQYYLDLANQMFPVIEISAGRPVTFVVTTGATLKLKGRDK